MRTPRTVGVLAGAVAMVAVALGAVGDEWPQVSSTDVVAPRVTTHGVSVSISVSPLCPLAGGDPDANRRADEFLVQLRTAFGKAVSDVEFPLGFSEWMAHVDLESQALPPKSLAAGVRIVRPLSGLDRVLVEAMHRGQMPKLPNFRARCTFAVRIQPWQPSEPG